MDQSEQNSAGLMSYFVGIFFLTMVILHWVSSSVLIKLIFDSEYSHYEKPFFATYFDTSFFILYLLPFVYSFVKLKWKARESDHLQQES